MSKTVAKKVRPPITHSLPFKVAISLSIVAELGVCGYCCTKKGELAAMTYRLMLQRTLTIVPFKLLSTLTSVTVDVPISVR